MISGVLEQVLYDLANSRRSRSAYLEDPKAFLSRYRLEADEADLIRNEEVSTLMKRGANPMLLMGFYMGIRGPKAMPEYLRKIPTLESCLEL